MDSLIYGDLLPQPAEARVTLRNKEYIICSDHPENNSNQFDQERNNLQTTSHFQNICFPELSAHIKLGNCFPC